MAAQAGLCLTWSEILRFSRDEAHNAVAFFLSFRKLKVILPLPPLVHKLILLLPLYFGFAVVYDVYSTIHDIVIEHSISPGKVITQGVPTGIIKNTSVLLASNMTTITSTHFYNSTTLSAVATNFSSTSTLTPL